MPKKKIKKEKSPPVQPASLQPDKALEEFQPFEGKLLRFSIRAIPWVMLAILLFLKKDNWSSPGGSMWNLSYAVAAISIFILQRNADQFPVTLRVLWDRRIIRTRSKHTGQVPSKRKGNLSATSITDGYREFIEHAQTVINSPRQYYLSVFTVFLVIAYLVYQYQLTYARYQPGYGYQGLHLQMLLPSLVEFIFVGIPAFLGGVVLWRMVVIGFEVKRLSKNFDVHPQLGHPDQSGGLALIGQLCFRNALVISMVGVLWGGWIIVSKSLPFLSSLFYRFGMSEYTYYRYISLAKAYAPLLTYLLLIPIFASAISFFWPILEIHKIMVNAKIKIRHQLDQLSEEIDILNRDLLSNASTLDPAESENMAQKLAMMRRVYDNNKVIPEWPFNTRTFFRFIGSQLVPVLGLTGLGQEIVKFMASLITTLISIQ